MRESGTENWLTKHQYPFEYLPSVSIRQIHLTTDAKEQIRLGDPIDIDHVGLIKSALQDGVDLPAIVVYRDEQPDVLKILDGIHRTTAYVEVSRQTLDVYVVDVGTQADVEFIRRTINLKNGKNFNKHDRLEQAKQLKLSMGWSAREAARVYGLSESTVSGALAADESLVRLMRLTEGTIAEVRSLLPTTALLARLREVKRDDLVLAIFDVAKRTYARDTRKLSGDVLEPLCRQAKEAVTDTAALALVKRWATEYPARKVRVAKAGPLPDEPAIIHRARREVLRLVTYLEQRLVRPPLSAAQRRQAVQLAQWAVTEIQRKVVELERASKAQSPAGARVQRPSGGRRELST